MRTCPVCHTTCKQEQTECPKCSADLILLQCLDNQASVFYNQGLAFAKEGSYGDAAGCLNAAIAVDPSHLNAIIVLGKVLGLQGDIKAAVDTWHGALTVAPETSPECKKVVEYIECADDHIRAGRARQTQQEKRKQMILLLSGTIVTTQIAPSGVGANGNSTDTVLQSDHQQIAKDVSVIFHKLPESLKIAGANSFSDLKRSQLDVRLNSNTISISGAAPSPAGKKLAVALAQVIASDLTVDGSGIKVADDYSIYVVDPADATVVCYETISEHFCGDPKLWPQIHQFNVSVAKELADPYTLKTGAQIRIPFRLLTPQFAGRRNLKW